jgi:hypothetical protein
LAIFILQLEQRLKYVCRRDSLHHFFCLIFYTLFGNEKKRQGRVLALTVYLVRLWLSVSIKRYCHKIPHQ